MNVLSIGARKSILTGFSRALEQVGFQAHWTNNHTDTGYIINKYPPGEYDIVTFGRGVSAENKKLLQEEYARQHPGIRFVEGLAPIRDLLVDQVLLAAHQNAASPISVTHTGDLKVTTAHPCRLAVKRYHLNFLFQSSSDILFDQEVKSGPVTIPYKKKWGRNFIVIRVDDQVVHIQNL